MATVPDTSAATRDFATWSVDCRLVVTDADRLDEAGRIVDDLLAGVDVAASRFRADSELRRLRAGAQTVSPLLAELIGVALDAAEQSGGLVDPTVGGALLGVGYDADFDEVRSRTGGSVTVRRVPGWRSVRLEGDRLTLPPGTLLDLGATAKAYAADVAARTVAERLDTGVLLALGGDVATAGPGPEGGDWQVTVQDVTDDPAQQVGLAPGAAIATSSTVRRRWRTPDGTMHHVIDPATGLPSRSGWRSVSVVAPTCTEANLLCTATLARADGLALLRRSGLPARLLDASGRTTLLGAWPREVAA